MVIVFDIGHLLLRIGHLLLRIGHSLLTNGHSLTDTFFQCCKKWLKVGRDTIFFVYLCSQ